MYSSLFTEHTFISLLFYQQGYILYKASFRYTTAQKQKVQVIRSANSQDFFRDIAFAHFITLVFTTHICIQCPMSPIVRYTTY